MPEDGAFPTADLLDLGERRDGQPKLSANWGRGDLSTLTRDQIGEATMNQYN